jgi:hypothetical protein
MRPGRDPAGAPDLAAGGFHQPGRVPEQRRLAGAVPAHQRDPLPWSDRQRQAVEDGRPAVDLMPYPVERERWIFGAPARPAILPVRGAGHDRIGVRKQPACSQHRASGLHARHRRQPETVQEAGARGGELGGGVARPGQELGGRGVAHHAPGPHGDRPVGEAQAALEPVLGDHDRRVEVLVEPAKQRDQLVAGDRVELRGRLVEQDQLRPAGERRAEGHALELATGELGGRAVEQLRDPERERRLLDGPRHRRRRLPLVLERERELGANRAHHDLRLGVLEQRADGDRERSRRVLARVHAGDRRAAGEHAAVEVRHEPVGGAQQRRLARARPAGEDHQLARTDLE